MTELAWPFAGNGATRDQVCDLCGSVWSCVTVLGPWKVCGRCRGWHDPSGSAARDDAVRDLTERVAARARRAGR